MCGIISNTYESPQVGLRGVGDGVLYLVCCYIHRLLRVQIFSTSLQVVFVSNFCKKITFKELHLLI